MASQDYEDAVKKCYATWGRTYFDEYYGPSAPYPPVHREIIKEVVKQCGARTLLDAGCGPASILRDFLACGIDPYGFDLSPEMIAEAKRVFAAHDIAPSNLWEGSVLRDDSFRHPSTPNAVPFDAALCIGVLPHISVNDEKDVLSRLRRSVKPGGTVVIEARNQLFSLFTLNRPSFDFFAETLTQLDALIGRAGKEAPALRQVRDELQKQFRMDLPPTRKGKQGEPGYDEIVSRTHNPFELRANFERAGFARIQTLFYHYHCLPPMFEHLAPEAFRRESVALETPDDWRGHFMASAFLLVGTAI